MPGKSVCKEQLGMVMPDSRGMFECTPTCVMSEEKQETDWNATRTKVRMLGNY